MNLSKYLIVPALLISFVACKSEQQQEAAGEMSRPATRSAPVPAFNRDSAYMYVEKQLTFGPRVPNSEAHQACKDWLAEKFKSFGAEVIEQDFQAKSYTGEQLNGTNVIAQYNPQINKRIILAAHWDTRFVADSPLNTSDTEVAVMGADDGASGVAVLLEIARQLQENPIDIGVDIILFDLEDQGESGAENEESWGLGAQHWSRNPHRAGYRAQYGILLDMVGAKDARFPKEYYSMYFAPNLVNKVWKLAENMGYGNYFVPADGGGVTDDHYFVNTIAGIKMIDIINRPAGSETGFGDHWHTPNDNIDIINKRTLGAVGQVVLAVVYRENNRTF